MRGHPPFESAEGSRSAAVTLTPEEQAAWARVGALLRYIYLEWTASVIASRPKS